MKPENATMAPIELPELCPSVESMKEPFLYQPRQKVLPGEVTFETLGCVVGSRLLEAKKAVERNDHLSHCLNS